VYVIALTSRVVMTRRYYDISIDLAPEQHVYRFRLTSFIDLYMTLFVNNTQLPYTLTVGMYGNSTEL
jgi:hypothetical protein